jgi:hypothetical protein
MPFSLAMSMSMVVKLFECRIDAAVANGVRWWACSVLVAAVLYFPEQDADLEVLGSGRSVGLVEDEANTL